MVFKTLLDAIISHPTMNVSVAVCEKCRNPEAYYMQIQIRSADEPMTTFYRCTDHRCGNQWQDD